MNNYLALFLLGCTVSQVLGEEALDFCRFGDVAQGCVFGCDCDKGCDRQTGACLKRGRCNRIKDFPYFYTEGTACLSSNVALHKYAYNNPLSHTGSNLAYYAVDGNHNKNDKCAWTNVEEPESAWLYVDLFEEYVITSVILFNYGVEGYYSRTLMDFTLHVGNSEVITDNPVCGEWKGSIGTGDYQRVACSGTGQYVGVRRNEGNFNSDVLHIYCSACPVGVACNDEIGCHRCPKGMKYPNCTAECPEGTHGHNCEKRCSVSGCQGGTPCHTPSGLCTYGCGPYEADNTWKFGATCQDLIEVPAFTTSDSMPTLKSTANSIQLEWVETDQIPTFFSEYISYFIYHRKVGETTWVRSDPLSYKPDESFQRSEITGLDRGTEYQVDITIAREFGADYFESPFIASSAFGPMFAVTLGRAKPDENGTPGPDSGGKPDEGDPANQTVPDTGGEGGGEGGGSDGGGGSEGGGEGGGSEGGGQGGGGGGSGGSDGEGTIVPDAPQNIVQPLAQCCGQCCQTCCEACPGSSYAPWP